MKRVLLTGLVALALAAPARAEAPLPSDVAMLQALVRADTTNPPGGEAAAARLVAGWLADAGIPCHLYESAPGRASVIARLTAGEKPDPDGAVLLLGHLDVVTAEPTRWHHPPLAAELVDGTIWGRGTLDMKDLVVMELRAFIALAHSHRKLARDVIFCASADEEAGGEAGVGWLLAHHADELRCAEVLNEGGSGLSATPGGRPIMGIQVAERGALWVRVTAGGRPGHGGQDRPDSATRRLLRALARVESRTRTFELGPETGPMLNAMAEAQGGTRGLLLRALANPLLLPLLAPTAVAKEPLLGPLFGTTVNPDVLQAGEKVNVVPGTANCELDIRMLPGHTAAETLDWLKRTLDDPNIQVAILHASDPSRSPADGRLYRCLADAARAAYPGVIVTPIITPGGGTDSPYFRRLGARAYGCAPILTSSEQISSIHGDDEYITVGQLAAGCKVVEAAVQAVATEP